MERIIYIQCVSVVLITMDIITVTGNPLRTMTCPYKCECHYNNIFCDSLGFHTIPSNLPLSTKTLDMRLNNVTQLHGELWELEELETFDLSYNKLYYISKHAFAQNGNLQDIQLEGNNLSIRYFIPKDWGQLLKLRSLNVADNQLGPVLTAGIFKGLTALQILDLSSNRIISIPEGTFQGLRSLNHLILKSNQLSQVPALALQSLSGLQTLDLSRNPINVLDEESFPFLLKLDALLLNSMGNLTDILDQTFSSLPNLRVIEITMCPKLIHISVNAFKGLTNIQLVYLNGNHLQHLNKELLSWDKMPNNGVRLYDNPWICDCAIKWMTVNIVTETLNKPERMICSEPLQLNGQQLTTIDPNHLVCADHNTNKHHSEHNSHNNDWLTGDPKKDYEKQMFPKIFAIVVPTFVCSSIFFLLLGAYFKRTQKTRREWLLRSFSYGSLQRDNYACTASNMNIPYENPANEKHECK